MSMYKEIIYNDKKYLFKCSGGTDMLFKRMFGVDLDMVYTATVNDLTVDADVPELLKTAKELRNRKDDDPEKIRGAVEFLSKNKNVLGLSSRLIEFTKEFAFITYLEANHEPKEIAKYLNSEEFVYWLMNFPASFFREHVDTFRDFYQENIHQTSKPKN